jgi:translation initiation factor 2 subunit 2
MTEEDAIFDHNLKKKKKKKKTAFDLDAALAGDAPESNAVEDAADEIVPTTTTSDALPAEDSPAVDKSDDINFDDDYSNLTKKKKKKKKVFDLQEVEDALPKEEKGDEETSEKMADDIDLRTQRRP